MKTKKIIVLSGFSWLLGDICVLMCNNGQRWFIWWRGMGIPPPLWTGTLCLQNLKIVSSDLNKSNLKLLISCWLPFTVQVNKDEIECYMYTLKIQQRYRQWRYLDTREYVQILHWWNKSRSEMRYLQRQHNFTDMAMHCTRKHFDIISHLRPTGRMMCTFLNQSETLL